jgi:hypothetical protein
MGIDEQPLHVWRTLKLSDDGAIYECLGCGGRSVWVAGILRRSDHDPLKFPRPSREGCKAGQEVFANGSGI